MFQKGWIIEAHRDRCSLLEGKATKPIQEKLSLKQHVNLNQGHNSGSPK